MNSDLEISNRVIRRLPSPSITNNATLFPSNESTTKAGKDEFMTLEYDENVSSPLMKEKDQTVSSDDSTHNESCVGSSLSSFAMGNANCSPGKHYDMCTGEGSETEDESDAGNDGSSESSDSDDDSEDSMDGCTVDESESICEDKSESDKSDSSGSATEVDDFGFANQFQSGKDFGFDKRVDVEEESRDNRCDMVLILSRKNAIVVESSIGNLSSDDNLTSDEESVESEESENESDDLPERQEPSEESDIDPIYESETSENDESHSESEDESGTEGVEDDVCSGEDCSETDESYSESEDESSTEDVENSVCSSDGSCADVSENGDVDEDSDGEDADGNQVGGFSDSESQESEDGVQCLLISIPKTECVNGKIQGLPQTDEISIEELEGIINESSKEDDMSEIVMDFSDTEREQPSPPSRKSSRRNYDDSPSNGARSNANEESHYPHEESTRSKRLLKTKRSLSSQLLSSLLSEPLSGSPKRHRSTSTCDSNTCSPEKDVIVSYTRFPPLPPLPITFGKDEISATEHEIRYAQPRLQSERSALEEETIVDRVNERIAGIGVSLLDSAEVKRSTPPIVGSDDSRCDLKTASYASPVRVDGSPTLARSSTLTPVLEGISVSMR